MNDAVRLSQWEIEMEPETYHRRCERCFKRLDQLVEQMTTDADVERLQKRLRRHRDKPFTFLFFDHVSPYNNHAEQQVRGPVIMRKISQQNRSVDGAEAQAISMSLFRSYHLQKLNLLETLLMIAKTAIAGGPIYI